MAGDAGTGSSQGAGTWVLSGALVAATCIDVGFRGESLVTAIAIAKAESTFNAWAMNDASNDGVKWGPAVGLFQVRCLLHPKSYSNAMDRRRSVDLMKSPVSNAQFAYDVSGGGKHWDAWNASKSKWSTTEAKAEARQFALNPDLDNAPRQRGPDSTGAKAARGVPLIDNDWIDEDRNPLPINIGADAHPGELGNRVVDASIEYSMAESSLSRFEVEDQAATLLTSQRITEGVALSVAGRRQIITAVGAKQGPGSPHFTLEAQPAGVVRLRGVTPAATTRSAVKFARNLAKFAGMRFAGGPASPSIAIAPKDVDLGGTATTQALDPTTGMAHGTRKENAWEVLQRLAKESTGYVCFEAGNTLHFATQQWLYDHAGIVFVKVGSATFDTPRKGTAIRAVGFPDISRSIKRDGQNHPYRHAEVTVNLPPGRGYNALPGMRLWLAEPSGLVEDAREMLITRTSIAGGDRTALVRVQATSYSAPGDTDSGPPATTHDGSSGTVGTTGGGPGTSQNGWPASSNAGKIGVTTYHVGGVSLPIANRAAKVLTYVAAQFDKRVESLGEGCWGWSYRTIRGSATTLSNHSSGTAIDLNAPKHPLGASGTFSGRQVDAIRAILVECKGLVRWGGNYNGRKDEMHFEIDADPSVVKKRFG